MMNGLCKVDTCKADGILTPAIPAGNLGVCPAISYTRNTRDEHPSYSRCTAKTHVYWLGSITKSTGTYKDVLIKAIRISGFFFKIPVPKSRNIKRDNQES